MKILNIDEKEQAQAMKELENMIIAIQQINKTHKNGYIDKTPLSCGHLPYKGRLWYIENQKSLPFKGGGSRKADGGI